MRPMSRLEVDQATEGPRLKPKTTKAAQLAAANRALAESEAALALAAAEAEAERRTLLDRIRALESNETEDGNHLGLPLSPAYSFTDRATAHSTRVRSRLLVPPAPPRRCSWVIFIPVRQLRSPQFPPPTGSGDAGPRASLHHTRY